MAKIFTVPLFSAIHAARPLIVMTKALLSTPCKGILLAMFLEQCSIFTLANAPANSLWARFLHRYAST